jgi:hypothetical protein
MDSETAKLIVIVLAAVGVVAWLAGMSVMQRATREQRLRSEEAAERFETDRQAGEAMIVGMAEIEGQPETLTKRLTELLARDGLGPLGPVKILGCDRHEVTFETGGAWTGPSGFSTAPQRRGQIRLLPNGSRTRVEYAIEAPSGTWQLVFGWLFVVLGIAAIVIGVWLEFSYVVDSPNPGVRAQAVQMVQTVHFLWPPFLAAYLARQPNRMLRTRIETLIHNLPYV